MQEDDIPMLGVTLFGWDVWRIHRDKNHEMIQIILKKGDKIKEFTDNDWKRANECDPLDHDYTGDPTVSASGGTCVKCGHFEPCG